MSDLKDSQQTAYKFSVTQLNKTYFLRLVKMSSSSPLTCVNEQNKKELLEAITWRQSEWDSTENYFILFFISFVCLFVS